MNLKRQLLLLSCLLSLSLPWAGCQFVRELESALRQGQERSLQATAMGLARVLEAEPAILDILRADGGDGDNDAVQFEAAKLPLVIDGYSKDWVGIESKVIRSARDFDQRMHYKAATINDKLYLFIEVQDKDINYFNPSKPKGGDRIELVLGGDEFGRRSERFVLASSTPGKLNVRRRSTRGEFLVEEKIAAHWQDTVGGFQVEIGIPLTLTAGRFGFYRADEDIDGNTDYYGSIPRARRLAPRAIFTTDALAAKLEAFEQPGQKLSLISRNKHIIAEQGQFSSKENSNTYWLLRKLYRTVLDTPRDAYSRNLHVETNRPDIEQALGGNIGLNWYHGEAYTNRSILGIAIPLRQGDEVLGAVSVEQSGEQFLALTDTAFTRLFLLSFMAIFLLVAGLVAYASWLSLRIRRLSQAAERAVNEDGSVNRDFPKTRARDEIGDLSRNYSSLVERVGGYTDYLQTLSRKLSHELRTPLAVVHSSLDNMEEEENSRANQVYLTRAKGGALQLSHMITALSEATRVEESISSADKEPCNILELLNDISHAYNDTFPLHHVRFDNRCAQNDLTMQAAPELMAQMLDKLLENAADFSPEDSTIDIAAELKDHCIVISVSNEGSALTPDMHTRLFQNLVSMRSDIRTAQKQPLQKGNTHLGLGLYIVKLIVNFHQGKVRAYNLVNDIGVCFEVSLPIQVTND